MTDQLERELVAAFEHLGKQPPPVDLTRNALGRARRTTSTRRAATAIGAAGLVTAVVLGVSTVVGSPRPADPAGTARIVQGLPGPRIVTTTSCQGSGYLRPGTHTREQQSDVLDRVARRYVSVPYCDVVPSPDGRLAIVSAGDGSAAHPLRTGVLDVHTRAVRWIEGGFAGAGSWSRNGTRILLTGGRSGLSEKVGARAGRSGFVLVDPVTLATTFLPVPDVPNGLGSAAAFTPDGEAIAMSVCSCPPGSTGPATVAGLRLYDLAGRVLRTLPATGVLTAADAYSPDGRWMALTVPPAAGGKRQVQIADTGAVRRTIPIAYQEFVGWYDPSHLVVSHRAAHLELMVVDLAGRLQRLAANPVVLVGTAAEHLVMRIGPADGVRPDSAASIIPF